MSKPVRVSYGDQASQFADLRLPSGSGPHPVVIVIHGGFWRARFGLTETEEIAADITRSGFATWNIEYRRVGEPGGGWPGTLHDVAQAADHLTTLREVWPLDLNCVVTLGHSAGGHLALWLAARHKLGADFWNHASLQPAGVVSLAGVCDLSRMASLSHERNPAVEFLGGKPSDLPERYAVACPRYSLPLSAPQILLHGDLDDRVPLTLSEHYAEQAKAAGDDVTFHKLRQVGHFEFLKVESDAWQQSRTTLQQQVSRLRRPPVS